MKKSVRIYVSGSVQGIFYRQFVKDNAERYNLRGFVRNLEDGRVEIFIEGDLENIDKMIKLIREGPKYSQIKNAEIKEEKFQDFKEFKILHI